MSNEKSLYGGSVIIRHTPAGTYTVYAHLNGYEPEDIEARRYEK